MKTFCLVVLCLFLATILIACDGPNKLSHNNSAEQNVILIKSEYFKAMQVEDLGANNCVIVDETTGVLYLVIGGYQSAMMTPIYNADGSLKNINDMGKKGE